MNNTQILESLQQHISELQTYLPDIQSLDPQALISMAQQKLAEHSQYLGGMAR